MTNRTLTIIRATAFTIACASCLGATGVDVHVYTDVECTAATPDVAVVVGADLNELQNNLAVGLVSATKSGCTTGDGLGSLVGDFVIGPSQSSDESIAFAVMTRLGGGIADDCGADAGLSDCIIVKRWVGFVPHTTLSLDVQLEKACSGVNCLPDYTCVVGACVPVARTGGPPRFPTDGITSYWRLDGDGTDASGNGHNLAPFEGNSDNTLQFTPGKLSLGLFPQYAADLDCSNCAALDSSSPPDLSGDFTISLWAKPSTDAVDGGAAAWWESGMMSNGQIRLGTTGQGPYPTPNYLTLVLQNGTTQVAQIQDNTYDFRAGASNDVFVHVIAFRQGDTVGLRLNGHQTTMPVSGSVGAPSMLRVGLEDDGYPWQGVIDEVGIWNRALTPSEMDALFNGGAGLVYP